MPALSTSRPPLRRPAAAAPGSAWLLLSALVLACFSAVGVHAALSAPSTVRVGESFVVRGSCALTGNKDFIGLFAGDRDPNLLTLADDADLHSDRIWVSGNSFSSSATVTFSSVTPPGTYYVCCARKPSVFSGGHSEIAGCSEEITVIGPQRPLVLVPGVCGSVMNARDSMSGRMVRVWVVLVNAMSTALHYLTGRWNPESNVFSSLLESDTFSVGPDTSNYGLDGIDILDPSLIGNLAPPMWYWHQVIQGLHAHGYKDGETLFGFPYDWRQSTRSPVIMDAFLERLRIASNDGATKVDVVTHSMGGLVFKSFLATNRGAVEQYVNRWVAIAAPFLGGGGVVLNGILEGYNMGHPFLNAKDCRKMLLTTGSFYELLPAFERSKWDRSREGPPSITVAPKGAAANTVQTFVSPDFVEPTRELTADLRWTYSFGGLSEELSYPAFPEDLWASAQETHRLWDSIEENGGLPDSVDFAIVYSEEMKTNYNVSYMNDKTLFTTVPGDGTVPRISALSHGLGENQQVKYYTVKGDHVGLLRSNDMAEFIWKIVNPMPEVNAFSAAWLLRVHPILAAVLAVCAVAVLFAGTAFALKLVKNRRQGQDATPALPLRDPLLDNQLTV